MINENISLPLLQYILIGCTFFFVLFTFLKRLSNSKIAVLEERLLGKQHELELLRAENLELEVEFNLERQQRENLMAECAAMKTALENEQRFAIERQNLTRESREQIREAFQSLSGQALEKSSRLFLSLAETQLTKQTEMVAARLEKKEEAFASVVDPIQKTLEKLDSQIVTVEKERLSSRDAMSASISNLLETHKQLSKETVTLSNALRSPVVTGQWGEMHLRKVIELAGLVDHCDFQEQRSLDAESGRQRPDLVIQLPSGKSVIVDAKAPLKEYLAACQASDLEVKKRCIEKHARALRKHVQLLSQKKYYDSLPGAVGFVVLFLPAEPLLSAALKEDPALTEYAVGQNIILATPLSLIALCRTIATGWREEAVHENATRIAEIGRQLLKRLVTFSDHFDDLYKGLEKSTRAYNKIVGSYESRVLVSARELAESGVGEQIEIPKPKSIQSGLRVPVYSGE